MNRLFALLIICTTLLVALPTASAVTIQWTPVGNPSNAPDTVVMTTDGTTGYGSVGYNYSISTNLVTFSQYDEFLNAKDPTGSNTLGLWNSLMADPTYGGINFNAGNANGNKYTLIAGAANYPANGQNWYSTLRFINWLDNGQGNG